MTFSDIHQNFAAQARYIAITNALIVMWPGLEKAKHKPHGPKDLSDNYPERN